MVWNHHASYAFPGELLIVLDVLLVLLAGGLMLFAPRWLAAISKRLEPLAGDADGAGRMRLRTVILGLGLLGLAGVAASLAVLGVPQAQVPDEASYLLAADTFASGRLSNPPHPMRAHFEMRHILAEPTYQSKYPPAQGLILGLGQRLVGHPAAGLAIQSALLAMAVAWALGGTLGPGWTLVGGLLVASRLAIGSYWNQGYWGGSMAAVGGALVLGGLLRLRRGPSATTGAVTGLGFGLLAIARPYEGFLMGLVATVILLAISRRWSWPERVRTALPMLVVTALGVGFLGIYNASVTGAPELFPHALYTHQRPDTSAHPELMHFVWEAPPPWLPGALRIWPTKASFGVYFLLGLGLLIPVLAAARTIFRRTEARIALALWVPVSLAHFVVRPWNPHYVAAATASAMLLATLALVAMAEWRVRGVRIGPSVALLAMAIQLVLALVQLPAHRADADDWSMHRAALESRLESMPGDDLLLVRYLHGRPHQWVWNDADIDASPVVWAESLGPEADDALRRYFADRRAWKIDVDFGPTVPELKPWD